MTTQNNVPFESIIGSVIFPNCERIAPGVSRHNFGSRIVFGSPAGKAIGDIVALFRRAGFDASRSDDIHSDIWNKAVGNMVMNPVSALTGATCDAILDDPDLRAFVQSMMHEAVLIGERITHALTTNSSPPGTPSSQPHKRPGQLACKGPWMFKELPC
jgi:2-dehydropantoate 2-reductase